MRPRFHVQRLQRLAGPAVLAATMAPALAGLCGCGERHQGLEPEPEPHDPRLRTLVGIGGETCTPDGRMVWVEMDDPGRTRFCVDRLEASLDGGDAGTAIQGADDETDVLAPTEAGATTALARVQLGVPPATGLTWWQAKAACLNAGKRLCTTLEWERACRGRGDSIYPYGDAASETACNGFFAFAEINPSNTGSLDTCGSDFGVYDLSGNVAEWTEDAVERIPGDQPPAGADPLDDRVLRGGSYLSNDNGLACFGAEFHAPPGQAAADRGWRCCSDGPPP